MHIFRVFCGSWGITAMFVYNPCNLVQKHSFSLQKYWQVLHVYFCKYEPLILFAKIILRFH